MTTALRIVYAGTPEFAVPALEALASSIHQVIAVYTQPDRPAGRGNKLKTSAVKETALRLQLPLEQPPNFRELASLHQLRSYAPDVLVVAAYGLLLPQAVLDIPRFGCINIHASLLPRWRGAAPIQRAILAGDAETGITIMRMEAGLDTGPMLAACKTPIHTNDTAATLQERLSKLGAQSLLEVLADLPTALATAQTQASEGVTYAKKLLKEEARINWSKPGEEIARQVRAFNPWPVAETRLRGEQLRIWEACAENTDANAEPGAVTAVGETGIRVATGRGVLRLTRVQLAGRKAVDAGDFAKGQTLRGAVLDS